MEIFKNGNIWLRADFHLHTKSDSEFKFEGKQGEFFEQYIHQLKSTGIGLGIVTNHNKFNKEEFKELKKKALNENIGLFPGIEFSLKEGIHILIIFDDIWYLGENNNIQDFINSAFLGIANYNYPPYPNSHFDLHETVEKLDQIGHDYFLIMAHVDEDNGLFKVIKGRTLEALVNSESFEKVLALQKSANKDTYDKLVKTTKRPIACVEGTDNASNGIDAIGKGRTTYVKIGDFNLEALKYALLDFENRIRAKDQPKINNCYIKSIEIEGGFLDKSIIDFSPELNNLIGIRGSGKSAIVEILRYALGIKLVDKKYQDVKYKNELVEYILGSGGKIIVTIINNFKEEYRIEKIYGHKEDIFKNGQNVTISTKAIFKQQPVYFGQKDLSNKDIAFEADLVEKLIGNKLDEIREDIKLKKNTIEQIIIELKNLENLEEIKKETNQQIDDATHTLKIFKDKGIEEKLKQQSNYDTDITKFEEIKEDITNFNEDLKELIDNYTNFFENVKFDSIENKELFLEGDTIFTELIKEFNKLTKIREQTNSQEIAFANVINKLKKKKESLKEEFAKIKREINIPSLNPDEFLRLNRQVEISKLKLKEIEKSEQNRKELLIKLSSSLDKLSALWYEEFGKLKLEVDKINKSDNPLTIEVEFKGRAEKYKDKMREIFKGSNIRENTYNMITKNYKDFIEIYKDNNALKDILNENQISAFNRIFAEDLSELLTYQVENRFIIKYKGKPLAQHSLGQRASALILFLLAQEETDILVIDQPEDDLDNQTIYEDVIKKLKSLKGDMQFIFATHNANIPVLGDSEKIFSCKFYNEKVEIKDGTIDNREIHKEIVSIMEGGEDAFKQRKKIYGLWRIEN